MSFKVGDNVRYLGDSAFGVGFDENHIGKVLQVRGDEYLGYLTYLVEGEKYHQVIEEQCLVKAIVPGDRVEIQNMDEPEDGMIGTVTFSKPDGDYNNSDDVMVLITDSKGEPGCQGVVMSYKYEHLYLVEPVVSLDQHHEAIDTLLPFV